MPSKMNLEMCEPTRSSTKSVRRAFLWLAALWLILPLAILRAQPRTECHDADLILRNGKIIRMDAARSTVTSLPNTARSAFAGAIRRSPISTMASSRLEPPMCP